MPTGKDFINAGAQMLHLTPAGALRLARAILLFMDDVATTEDFGQFTLADLEVIDANRYLPLGGKQETCQTS